MESNDLKILESIERRLREFMSRNPQRVTNQEAAEPQRPFQSRVIATDAYQITAGDKDYYIQEKIDRYMAMPIELPPIPPEYESLPSLTAADFRVVKYDFPDDVLMNKPGIWIERMDNKTVAELGRNVIPMVSSGFSTRGAAAIFLLACHVRKPGSAYGKYLFDGVDALTTIEDKKYDEYSDRPISVYGHSNRIIPIRDDAKEAAVYSYLAASMLRLFTKSPRNYVKAWNHILGGFSKFYGDSIEVMLTTPTEPAMRSLANCFSMNERLKIALYRILYVSNMDRSPSHEGLKRFLYDIHLSNTGMHIVNIILELVKILKCNTGVILTAINTGENARQVKCLVHVIRLLRDNGEVHKRKMWRYGRIFDETFMADLQTRSCPKLVYALAAALQQVAPDTHKDILQIAQLANVSSENQRLAKAAAQRLIYRIGTSSTCG